MNRPIVITLLAALAAVPLSAQSRLISLTRGTAPTVIQQNVGDCRVEHRCAPTGFPQVVSRVAGGTAHDSRTRGTWISNGEWLAKVDPDGCEYQCRPFRAPIGTNAVVTGLAMAESRNTLYVVDSSGVLTSLVVRQCGVVSASRCRISVGLPSDQAFGGLAVDETRGLLFYAASNFAGTSITQAVYVARLADPCNPFCATRMTNCPNGTGRLGGITGLAFSSCSDRLWATDGARVVHADFTIDPAGCSLSNYTCCGAPSGSLPGAVGLALLPAGATSRGRSCTNGACATCPRMEQVMLGDSTIGNHALRFALRNAPADGRAWFALGGGGCQLPGTFVPGFCGRVTVAQQPIPPIVVGPYSTGGTAGMPCSGEAIVEVPVPLDIALCGDRFSTQFLMLCFNPAGFGTGVSNCLEFTVAD